jgi:hypothetical protein
MGIGKILGYTVLGVVGGVAAVAAAPFTGGGSILGAATLAASLTGAGTIAAAAGTAAVAGGAGALLAKNENEVSSGKDNEIAIKNEIISNQNNKIAELKLKADEFEEGFKKAIKQFQGDKEYFNYIIGMTAFGVSMANADGKISKEEIDEMQTFIGGVVNSSYPSHIKDSIMGIVTTKPNFNTAILFLEKINPSHYQNVRNLIELVALADGIKCEKEDAFLKAFDSQITKIEYKPENNDYQKEFLLKNSSIN